MYLIILFILFVIVTWTNIIPVEELGNDDNDDYFGL